MSNGIPLDDWTAEQLEDVTPAPRVHVSKHRAGRQPKMSDRAKTRRNRMQKQRISDYLNERAYERAING